MTKIKILEKKLEEAREKYYKVYNNLPYNLSYEEFTERLKKTSDRVNLLDNRLRKIVEPTFQEMTSFGHRMSLDDFILTCERGLFIDYDGYGEYIKEDMLTSIKIYPSDVTYHKNYREDFDEIIWYNR